MEQGFPEAGFSNALIFLDSLMTEISLGICSIWNQYVPGQWDLIFFFSFMSSSSFPHILCFILAFVWGGGWGGEVVISEVFFSPFFKGSV